MQKNKSLVLFIGVGFIVTVLIWGFVGGCGTPGIHRRAILPEEPSEAEGLILEESSIPEGTIVYMVEAGDTLWEISRTFGVTICAIKEVNNLTTDTITVGQRLIIPVREDTVFEDKSRPVKEVRGDLVVYKVRKGDSLWRIAQVHGTTIERIVELNGIPRNARLKPGQELLIPKEK